MAEEEEGTPLSARDALACGEGFEDKECPVGVLKCGTAADGSEVHISVIVVKEVDSKLVVAVPSTSWHRTISRRTVPRGFLSRVGAAEVSACSLLARLEPVDGARVRVWLGILDVHAESAVLVPDELPEGTIGFGRLDTGEECLPFVPSLVAAAGDMFSFASAESGRAAEPDDLSGRLARLEKAVSNLVELKGRAEPPPTGKPKAKAKVPRGRVSTEVGHATPGLDPSVLAAARAAGVSEDALSEMQALVGRTTTGRLKPEPGPDPLEESEEEADGPDRRAWIFANALVRAVETMQRGGAKASSLDRALDGAASGSGESSSLPSARRNSAARRALRDALVSSPSEISGVIEALMSEDLSSVSPGVAVPGQTSARAWAEHRSKVTAYPSSVWAVWIMAGALDCLRTNRPEQARARLNLGLMIFDQMSIDRGSFVLASELALEVPPPLHSFRQHENHSTGQVCSRLLDPRWAEVAAIGHLKEQAEFLEKRAKLGRNDPPAPRTDADPDAEVFRAPSGRSGWKLKALSLAVAFLSWLYLGKPTGCPAEARAGVPLNRHQKRCVKRLEAAMFGTHFPFEFSSADLGRHAAKVESQSDVLQALGRAADSLCRAGGYLGAPASLTSDQAARRSRSWLIGSSSLAHRVFRLSLSWMMPRLIVMFGPWPLAYARQPCDCPSPPRVKVLARVPEKLKLYRALADTGRLQPARFPKGREHLGAGLFVVGKDQDRDRLILDARPANGLELGTSVWTKSLASAVAVSNLVLEKDRCFLFSGADLRECFYQFRVGEDRLRRNMIADRLTLQQATFVFRRGMKQHLEPDGFLRVAFASLAMGDCGACEYTQCAHLGVCVKGGVLLPGELLVHGAAPPRGLCSIGLVIDDLIDRVLTTDLEEHRTGLSKSVGRERLDAAIRAYQAAPLEVSEKKVFREQVQASFWGVTVCGMSGWLKPNAHRLWSLVLVTLRTVELGLATQHLLESLAGCWISIFVLRRRLLASMSLVFQATAAGDPSAVVRLSPELRAELAGFALLGQLCAVNLRAQVDPSVTATDASSSHQAAARAPLPQPVANEAYRLSVQKGAWTRLLTPQSAWLRSHDLLEPHSELPGDDEVYRASPLYCALAACPRYSELWSREYKSRVHINVAELDAFLREERRSGARRPCARLLFGIDSQVTIGCVAKGRSASPRLNQLLEKSIPDVLGSQSYAAPLYFP
ncbi:unnamed protein product, partial [Symbiodinium microadriaticum]